MRFMECAKADATNDWELRVKDKHPDTSHIICMRPKEIIDRNEENSVEHWMLHRLRDADSVDILKIRRRNYDFAKAAIVFHESEN